MFEIQSIGHRFTPMPLVELTLHDAYGVESFDRNQR